MEPLAYHTSYLGLPACAPLGHPHVISQEFQEGSDITNLRAADGVVTLLYKWNPDALYAFLELSYDYFEFVRREKDEAYQHLIVVRRGRKVTVRKPQGLSRALTCLYMIENNWQSSVASVA